MRTINEIIIHCSATKPEWMQGLGAAAKRDEIRRWHKAKGWKDIGYHMIIDRDGSVAAGRKVEDTGAHVRGHNANSLGVSLVGGFEAKKTDTFSQHFTPEQDAALRRIVKEWDSAIPNDVKISGHNEYANKGCPGFDVGVWLATEPKPAVSSAGGLIAVMVAILTAIIAMLNDMFNKKRD